MRRWLATTYWLLTAGVLLATAPAPAVVVYQDVADLTVQADQIVVGDVVEVTSFWNDDRTLIQSRIEVRVDDYLLGSGAGIEVLELDGGTIGDVTLSVSVLPTFEVGDRVLLFLSNSRAGRLLHVFQGAYLTDGRHIARMSPNCGERIIGESLQTLPEFTAEVARALPAGQVLPELTAYRGDFVMPPAVSGRYSLCGQSWAYQTNPMGEDYRVNANCTDSVAGDAASQLQQIQNGFTAWNNAGADFAFTYGGSTTQTFVSNNGTNAIFFTNSPPGSGDYVAVNYHWGFGGAMTESDIAFNDRDYVFWNGSGSCNNYMDIWNIMTHELGHTLCLLDLYNGSDSEKTMYGYVAECETKKRTLHTDDINGIIAIYGALADVNPPQPDPLTWAAPPTAYGPTTVSMLATEATDFTPPIEYYYWASNGNHRDWNTQRMHVDSAALPNTVQSWRAQARDSAVPPNVGSWSTTVAVTTPIETPAGLAFGTVTSTSIALQAQGTFTNLALGSSGLYFESTTGGGNAGIATWVQTTTDTATGLSPNTEYDFRVRARNQEGLETANSGTVSMYTLAAVPGAPTLTNVTTDSLNLTPDAGGNPAGTQLAIQCAASSDAAWNGKYVNAAGDPTASPVWQTAAQWGTLLLDGLQADTQYCFHAKARNAESAETGFSTQACAETQGGVTVCAGDANCDGVVNWRDIDFFVAAMNDNVAAWQAAFAPGSPSCAFANNDVDADGSVNWRDIDPLVAVMNTVCP